MRLRNLCFSAVVVVALVLVVPAFAQQVTVDGRRVDADATPNAVPGPTAPDAPGDSRAPNWGTAIWTTYEAAACDAAVRAGTWHDGNCAYVRSESGSAVAVGYPVHIPSGALAQYIRIYYNQTVLANTVSAGFYRFSEYGTLGEISTASPAAITTGDDYQDFGFSEVINNAPSTGYTYQILSIVSGATKVYKYTIYYMLQVSPAPGSATFTDVPTGYWAFRYIEALAASGITGGCGGGNYCPENYVKRSEIAVFLSKALGLNFEY